MLYLFDGNNILHAGEFAARDELVDRLASFVALEGARGVVVFDGAGTDRSHGPLEVRFATPADHLLERLAAANRDVHDVVLVSSDAAVRGTVGQEVRKLRANEFARTLRGGTAGEVRREPQQRSRVEDAVDETTRKRLEEWRRRRA